MTLSRINIVLAVALAFVVLSAALVRVDFSRPNFEIALGADMTYSPAYDSYAPNPNFADGRTLQSAVPGTIARGEMPLHYEATPESALLAGEKLFDTRELSSEDHSESLQRGAAAFGIFCAACHGGGGLGDGPITKRGFPPPPSLLTGKSLTMKDGQLFHILTYGQGSMPTFAGQLSIEQRWDVVNHIRNLQRQATPGDETATDATNGTEDDQKTVKPEDEGEQDELPREQRPALPGESDASGAEEKSAETEPAADGGDGAEPTDVEAEPGDSEDPTDALPTGAQSRKAPPAEQPKTTKDTERQP